LRDVTRVTTASYARYLAVPGTSWVAERDGSIAGCAIMDPATRSIWAMFLAPEHEGHGVGRTLLGKRMDYIAASGPGPWWLTTETATRAERFHRAAGWIARGTRDDEVQFELRTGYAK
jgi:GNAT superfamily N-acetyltransferase